MKALTSGSFGSLGKAVAGSFMSEDDDDRQRRTRRKPTRRRHRIRSKRR